MSDGIEFHLRFRCKAKLAHEREFGSAFRRATPRRLTSSYLKTLRASPQHTPYAVGFCGVSDTDKPRAQKDVPWPLAYSESSKVSIVRPA